MRAARASMLVGSAGVRATLALLLVLAPQALAAPMPNDIVAGELSVVLRLGSETVRARVGVVAGISVRRFWHDKPYYSSAQPFRHVRPLVTASARVGWARPEVWA